MRYDDSVFPTEFVWTFECQALSTKLLFNIRKGICNQNQINKPFRTLEAMFVTKI